MQDYSKIKTYSIHERKNKFNLEMMISPLATSRDEIDNLNELADHIIKAKKKNGRVLIMLGGAVIKEGCGALLIDLMKKGWIDHVAGNGSVSIHDYEIALVGETSEDVQSGLEEGTFGMVEETSLHINTALKDGVAAGLGYGASVGRMIEQKNLPHREMSVLYNAHKLVIPATIHVAIGGDIIHQHPSCDGAVLGESSFRDFQLITDSVSQLKDGAVLNIGSAVLMPEVFLKALTIARNLKCDVRDFATANFDFLDMYRPRTRILDWPKRLGATPYAITGHHRKTLSALHAALLEK